jgi:hypothetical protein
VLYSSNTAPRWLAQSIPERRAGDAATGLPVSWILNYLTWSESVSRAEKRRALYPGGRPTQEARAIHRRFVRGSLPLVLPIASVLEVRGRRSEQLARIPLAIVRYRRSWYLVSMFGEGSNWVKNVRASDGEVVLTHGRRRAVRLVEVPVPDRPPIIRRYLLSLPQEPHTQVRWKDPLPAFQVVAAIYPVFRVDHR